MIPHEEIFTEKWSLSRVWLKLLCKVSPSVCLAWSPCILGEKREVDYFRKINLWFTCTGL